MAGRPPSCLCGTCRKCRNREYQRQRMAKMTPEERRAAQRPKDPARRSAQMREAYYRNWKARRATVDAWRDRNREKANAISAEWAKRNRHKKAAQFAVWKATQRGELVRQPCEVCGVEPAHAHHDDYSRKLDVRWLCPLHHAQHHHPEAMVP